MPSIGKPLPHDSAAGHVTGGARYIDDLPRLAGELCVDFVGSPVAAGRVRSIDLQAARAVPGVVCVLTHEDLGGPNHFGPIIPDEPFLAAEEVAYVGQPVVVIAAETADAARQAREAVVADVAERTPILEIDDAIAAESYIGPERRMTSPGAEDDGAFEAAFRDAPHTLSGRFHSKGQEQFYFETQAALATPGEAGDVRVVSSTQNPTETQAVVAEALGLGMHQVVCECHRMGGGFGGKETQSAIPAVMAALVVQKTGRRPGSCSSAATTCGSPANATSTRPTTASPSTRPGDSSPPRWRSTPTAARSPTFRRPLWSGRCSTRRTLTTCRRCGSLATSAARTCRPTRRSGALAGRRASR